MIKNAWVLLYCLSASTLFQQSISQGHYKDAISTTFSLKEGNRLPITVQGERLLKRAPNNPYRKAYGEYSAMNVETLLQNWDGLILLDENQRKIRARRAAILDAIVSNVDYKADNLEGYIAVLHRLLGKARVRQFPVAVALAIRRSIPDSEGDRLTTIFARNRKRLQSHRERNPDSQGLTDEEEGSSSQQHDWETVDPEDHQSRYNHDSTLVGDHLGNILPNEFGSASKQPEHSQQPSYWPYQDHLTGFYQQHNTLDNAEEVASMFDDIPESHSNPKKHPSHRHSR